MLAVVLFWGAAYGADAAGAENKPLLLLLEDTGAAHGFPPEMELLAARLCGCCCGCDDPYAGGFGEA